MTTNARTYSADGSHWYSTKGEPCYELPKKDGSGMKVPTLADARKLDLLPSVTTILKVLDKPALNDWKVEQGVLAVLTTPRQPGESDDAFVHRVLHVEEVQHQEAASARDTGSAIHAALEAKMIGQEPIAQWLPWINPAAGDISQRGQYVSCEKILVGDGFAGKTDLIQETHDYWLLWDYKTTKKLPDPKKGAWTEHVLQLAAYAAALWKTLDQVQNTKPIRTANCYISTVEQGAYVVCENDPDWQRTYNQGFAPLITYWQWVNNYKAKQ